MTVRRGSRSGLGTSPDQTIAGLQSRLSRLVLDIHDGPMQNLTVIGLDLNALRARVRRLLPPDQVDQVDAAVDRVVDDLGDVERRLRELIASLERERAEVHSLREAIESEIAVFERHATAKVDFVITGTPIRLTEPERAAVHAIVRAALANVAKHADARTVMVHVGHEGDQTVLAIEDDGRGFNVPEAYKPGHFGLRGIVERAELAGGHAEVFSRPGGPTIVSAVLKHGAGVTAVEQLPAAV